jgi:uncharacterized iron-regulated membrane protein
MAVAAGRGDTADPVVRKDVVSDRLSGSASARGPRRPWAYTLHSLLGLTLSLLLCFVCLTGTLAVVSHEIDWLLRPEVRATAVGERVSWGRQLAAAREAFPHHSIIFAEAGEEPYLATTFEAIDSAGDLRHIYVDPGTGKVTGESDWLSLPGFVRALHYHLFTDRTGSWMFYAITSLGFVLLVSVVTGLLVYKRFWHGFARLPRRERGSRIFWGGLHRLVALWAAPFAVLIAVTSIWYFVERVLEEREIHFETYPTPLAASRLPAPRPQPPERLPLDDLLAIARREIPELTIERIWVPTAADEPLYVTGRGTASLVRGRADGVELDPYSGAVLRVQRGRDMGVVERWSHTADPLHFGDFAGWVSKLAWVVFGLLLSITSWSGVMVYLRRVAKALLPASGSTPHHV